MTYQNMRLIMQLTNQTILITGGTSGIGRALVEQLAKQNRSIILIARNAEKLQQLKHIHSNLHTYCCPLNNLSELKLTLNKISQQHKDISVVFNNAAIQYNKKFTDKDFQSDFIEEEITTNLTAPIYICAYFLPGLLQLGSPGMLINLSSGLAFYPKSSAAVYSSTKAGLSNFSQALGYQLENTSCRVIDVILPLVDTPMTASRGHGKLSATIAAKSIIHGIEKGKARIYPGKSRWLPLISRLCPSLLAGIMKAN
jgi:uncharacterized oxidoreductase